MKKISLLVIITIITLNLSAAFVSKKDAEKVAKSHYYQSINNIKTVSWEEVTLNCMFNPIENNAYNFYVFNVNGDEGYVIISSESKIQPILAYSFDGGFNHNNMSPGQKEFLNYFEICIDYVAINEMDASAKALNDWDELISYKPENGIKQKITSPNLLRLINWNQTWPYNAQCPEDSDGINGHVPVGCVATAMLHIMKYYNWPPSGEGSKYHSSWANGGYGNININFAAQTYDWYAIPNNASSYENEELGKINFHAGVGVSMWWGPDGSGSLTDKIEYALETYFRYSTATDYVEKSDYSETAWKNLIKAQIDAKKPLVYSGNSTTTGHAWNCDGYQDDEFHMNWGWGGAGNGYYTLDDLTSTATSGGPESNFNINQDMIINAYPRDTYPAYCPGTVNITGQEGSFGDGSSNDNYQSNSECVYVLQPTCGSSVTIEFNEFILGTGDVVTIFDGDESSTTLLATYDADNTPSYDNITGSNGGLTVKFDTDGTSTDEGWNLNYRVKNCITGVTYENGTGNINDGSGSCNYSNSTVCNWCIEPAGAQSITITFDDFDLAGNLDNVSIYKNSLSSSNLIEEFNDGNVPSGSLTVNSGVVYVQFFADGSDNADGWSLHYTSSTNNVEDNTILSEFSVMPNPGNNNSKLLFTLSKNSNTKIFITNLLGEIIAIKEFNLLSGTHEYELNNIIKNKLEAGVYIINIDAENQLRTQKLVVIE